MQTRRYALLVAETPHLPLSGRLQAATSLRLDTLKAGEGVLGEGRQAQMSLLCLKFPGSHVLRWLEAAGG